MTNTGHNRVTQKSRLDQFLDSPWPVLAVGLGIGMLSRRLHLEGFYGFLLDAGLVAVVLAGFVLLSRLRAGRALRNPVEPVTATDKRDQVADHAAQSGTNWLGVDVWTILIPLVIVWATLLAREHGWLGGNVPERTNWIVVLGLVFIAGVCRLWWRSRKKDQATRSSKENGE